ncbi:TetR/AcrR family transcriptional regulator [Streptomyces sp. MNP-20]|uniref:TetR/AcrR family transcriptional regulator n=1 Tax=Streptomyces sp. MNP-20 TaxID=2721165 RepID=UPI001558111A|nr:TetR/AcrR family transcriptional regulator [Streptomyces sp. MNP-20]
MSTPPRRPRADAGRNRTRVLETAVALFAERGAEVQMAEVAKAAGVGVGTVYRHFPTRQALIEAVAEQRFVEILAFARTACPSAPTARAALKSLMLHIGRVHERGRTLSLVIESALGATSPRGQVGAELKDVATEILDRGRDDGTLRADATFGDLYMIVGALAAVARADLGDWRRFVDITLTGLEPQEAPSGPDAARPAS